MNRVVLAGAVRTPVGAFQGNLAGLSEQELAAEAMKEAIRRGGIESDLVDEVILGIAKQTSRPSNGARHALLLARLPDSIPAYTVQRQSASGLQAIVNGCLAIRSGEAATVLAGGAESMSQIPFELYRARFAFEGKTREFVDPLEIHGPGAQGSDIYGRLTEERVARTVAQRYGISQNELEDYAALSLDKARRAAEGDLGSEMVPLVCPQGKKEVRITGDELAGEASPLAPYADGAAMCLLMEERKAKDSGVIVKAEILSLAIAAASPPLRFMAAVLAGRRALAKAGVSWGDLAVIELQEMTAAESLAILKEWQGTGLWGDDLGKVNPSGGALACGSPWGAAGAILVVKAARAISSEGGPALVVSLGEGGQAMALVLEGR